MVSREPRSSRLAQTRVLVGECRGIRWLKDPHNAACICPNKQGSRRPSSYYPTRPQVRRDYPLSLSISISGGKETYKDSLSNGERTGNSPA